MLLPLPPLLLPLLRPSDECAAVAGIVDAAEWCVVVGAVAAAAAAVADAVVAVPVADVAEATVFVCVLLVVLVVDTG